MGIGLELGETERVLVCAYVWWVGVFGVVARTRKKSGERGPGERCSYVSWILSHLWVGMV